MEHAARPRPIDSGDKRAVLAAGKSTVKGAAEAKRKRHPGISPDNPKIGNLRPGDQSNQCRLAGTIDSENSKILAGIKSNANVVEHGSSPAPGAIDFGDPVERDHSGS